MIKNENIHVVKTLEWWWVKIEGNTKNTCNCPTKEEAVKKWRILAKENKVELIIHKENGQIERRDFYGDDSIYRKG